MSANTVAIARGRTWAVTGRGKRARITANLPIRTAAADVGVAPATLLSWESGRKQPRGEHAVRYADLILRLEAEFGVTPAASAS